MLRLLGALRDCARHVQRGVAEHPLDEVDVGLLALAEQGDGELRPSQAAQRLEVASPSITRHTRALEAAGRLAVHPDAGDRRSYRIALTDEGRSALGDFRERLAERFAPVLADWSAEQVEELARGLARLNESMDAQRAAAGPSGANTRSRPGGSPSWWRGGRETERRT